MSALQAVMKFVQMLQGPPAAVIAADRIGLARPRAEGELPTITVAVTDARESPVGIGRHVALTRVAPEEWSQTTGSRCRGELRVEVWAATAAEITTITDAVLTRVGQRAAALRLDGFADVSLRSLGPAQPSTAGADAAQVMPLAFEITYEDLVTPPPGGEGILRTVHVDLAGEIDETLEVP